MLFDGDKFSRVRMLHDLAENEAGTLTNRDERKALKRAKAAEKRFRKSKGYEPDTFWYRLWKKIMRRRK